MGPTYVAHIVTGGLALAAGFAALYAAKGSPLHRRSGIVFVATMLAVCSAGVALSVGRSVAPAINVPIGLLTAYLAVTALTTVRPETAASRGVHIWGLVLVAGVTVAYFALAAQARANGGLVDGVPAGFFLAFGTIGLVATVGDVRVLRCGRRTGAARLARHLWRMCFALFVAALSFFFGQAQVIPEPLRIRPLLALPILAVLVTMLYWLWRVRFRRASLRRIRQRVPSIA